MLILFADVADTDGFIGRLNFSPANDHIKRNCAKVTSKKSKLSRVGGRGRFRGREGLSWAAPAALRETSSRPRATLFFSAGFFSLEKKRVQTSKTRFVHGDRGKILRMRLKTERRILSCLICCVATRANRFMRFKLPARGITISDTKRNFIRKTKKPRGNDPRGF